MASMTTSVLLTSYPKLLVVPLLKNVGKHCVSFTGPRVCVSIVQRNGPRTTNAQTVQLHALQEVFAIFNMDDDQVSSASEQTTSSEHLLCALSTAAMNGAPSSKSICLLGTIQHRVIRILIDSGSSHSFISDQVADQLQGVAT